MTSLSDSQNIDLNPGGPTIPPGSPLQACPGCEAILDISDREPLERIACPQCGTEMLVRGQIAHYVITEVAGRGGMGVVYKAYDPSLDRNVAIKLLRKDQSKDRNLISQLETEAAVTASVNDPNVVRVYGSGEDKGRFYLVMELVDKGSLDNLIQLQGRVAEAQVLEIGMQAARGLRAAQQHGLIHRDVKPGNILFADAHTAKIVDFGLAVFQEQEESVRGEIWGTPYYVAPEKLDQQPEDFRSDMYSLGGTLFHALAGRPPFEAENASLVALKHLKSQQVSLQSFAPWVSNGTAHIINRMLNKDPNQRFQSYDELIDSFDYALSQLHHRGAGASAVRTRVALETEEDQRRYTWVFLGLAAVVVVIGIAFGINQWRHSGQPKAVPRAAVRTGARYEPLQAGIEALAAGKKESVDLFAKAAENPSLSPADRAWAQIFTGASMLVTGKGNEARNIFIHVGDTAAAVKDKEMSALLTDIGTRLGDTRPVSTELTNRLDTSSHEAAALLLYALHDWRFGKTDDAMAMFKKFRVAEPKDTAEWISQLKPVAITFIEKETAFKIGVDRLNAAGMPSERFSAADSLRKIDPAFSKRADDAINKYKDEIEKYKGEISRPPGSGIFRLANRAHGKVIEIPNHDGADNAKAKITDGGGATHQWWKVIGVGPDTVKLAVLHTGKLLTIEGDGTAENSAIVQAPDKNLPTQKWHIISKNDGWFKLQSESGNLVLAPESNKKDNGVPILARADVEQPEFQWRFDRQAYALGDFFGSLISGPQRGTFEFKDGVFTINNSSRDIWGNSDQFAFVWRQTGGDFELVARVTEVGNVQSATKVGVMIRTGLASDDACAAALTIANPVGNPPKNTVNATVHTQRLKKNTGMTETRKPLQKLPCWLKLVRTGETVASFRSIDGTTWEETGTSTIEGFKGNAFAGLAVTSHKEDQQVTVKFDQVKITPIKK
jgi:Zn-finger nucleic acid-binding protein